MSILPDFPPGPLDFYRTKSSFDWKKMKIFLDTEDGVQFEKEISKKLQTHPEFQKDLTCEEMDEQRRISFRRHLYNIRSGILSENQFFENFARANVSSRLMLQLCPCAAFRFATGSLFTGVLRSQGGEQHQEILQQAENGDIIGSFCMTEVGHGSDIKGFRTTATYDKNTDEFVLHTPDFEAAKCWIGCMGQSASYAIVYAQLYVDGTHHGLHMFLVPIRNPKTLLTYPGVVATDMGEKIGVNGMDNGILILDKYRIPRGNLLNKSAHVTPDGKYVTAHKTRKEKNGAALGILSLGRSKTTLACETTAGKALTIAVRYAAVRKQFGCGKEEQPILEYQAHQYRLLPYLATAYTTRIFGMFLLETTYKFIWDVFMGGDKEYLNALGKEIHVISSASKPAVGWVLRDAIQECREACGGHGYLKAAGIGNIRNDNDCNMTFEGENHVIIQQTSNWLIKLWPEVEQDIMAAYQWLVCYLLKETALKYHTLIQKEGEFWARNNTQVYYAKSLSIAFVQNFMLQRTLVTINQAPDVYTKAVLLKLFSLYGLWSLEKFLATLYEGGYAHGCQPSRLIHEAILKLCSDIKNDSVSLVDAIAPPDFALNSVLGASDGQVYKRLERELFRNPYNLSRPTWWREMINWNTDHSKNKL
ncbi:peroxisomal acyl-coenzyme A oxidase 3-like isoform X2 [Zophobas morio]|uniref:peroxisomal acyl-coenzyme A oxidase 3-like isoform X2 n=1 Tax=Zophobas morio TaxID=2755281 RepID=UPI0030828B73